MWKKTGKSIALSAALLITAPVTMAQEQKEASFSDDQLSQYASARSEIKEVSQSFRGDMQEAENKKEAQKLRKEMQEAMVGAVESSGLSVEDYNKITKAVRQDKELQSKVRSMMESKEGQAGNDGSANSGSGSS